jgi:hypothetical protein
MKQRKTVLLMARLQQQTKEEHKPRDAFGARADRTSDRALRSKTPTTNLNDEIQIWIKLYSKSSTVWTSTGKS